MPRLSKQLVDKDDADSQGGYPANQENVKTEQTDAKVSMVGNLGINQLTVESPSYKQTDDDTAQGQDNLGRNEVEKVEQAEAGNLVVVPYPHGERTGYA